MRHSASIAQYAVLAALITVTAAAVSPQTPEFNRDIRPVLSENCFRCHGPDAAQRKAELRLDERENAVSNGAIVPRDPAASRIIQRVTSDDPGQRMPPPESNLTLTPHDVELLRSWITDGAPYQEHWAFVPPVQVPIPSAPESPSPAKSWGQNAIDAFIAARLAQEQLAPSPEAHLESLLRRLSLDLTGLPPKPGWIDHYLQMGDGAYEHAVDDLLASPAFGEHMAAMWLDAARYADTFGYQSDRETRLWPWRDWVIRAFNENLPYDTFIEWQLAGDLLPQPTTDQILATAFNRLHRQTNEGGSILEEFRTEYVADRTHTFGTAFLAMTLDCARCHDHKFDPISQRDYYSVFAFFNNIDESGMYSHFTSAVPSPSILLQDDGQRTKHHILKQLVTEREQAAAAIRDNHADRVKSWLASAPEPIWPPETAHHLHVPFDKIEGRFTTVTVQNTIEKASLLLDPEPIEGIYGNALRFSGDNGVEVPRAGKFDRTDPFTIALWLKTPPNVPRAVILHRTMAAEDAANRGYELVIEDNHLTFTLCHFWPGNAIRVRALEPLTAGEWQHVAVTYDGSSRANGLTFYLNAKPIPTETIRDNLFKTILYSPEGDGPPLTIASRFRDAGFKDGAIDEIVVFSEALTALEVRMVNQLAAVPVTDELSPRDLAEHYFARINTEYQNAIQNLHEARVNEAQWADASREIMVMREMPQPRTTRVLDRGLYDQPREIVTPNTPSAILPFPNDLPRNRLGLAKWLTQPEHPLTARVAVNRFWQRFFGTGLVETQEDFGIQGALPSHPELLDHLALWFIDNAWDVKALCRYIVTSATYRQTSFATPDLRQRDPGNVLLARGPRHRLSAEQIRDAALAASGLLNTQIGGPSVKPYQPEGLWIETGSEAYRPDTGDKLYRRSLYTFWKRTVPPPAMLLFDAPSRETCIARREQTATPLQSLVLLNDPQFVEAARVLAEDVLRNPDSPDPITQVFRRLLGRAPDDAERAILNAAHEEQLMLFRLTPSGARAYIDTGERQPSDSLDPIRVAALTAIAQLIMNFDEYVMKT